MDEMTLPMPALSGSYQQPSTSPSPPSNSRLPAPDPVTFGRRERRQEWTPFPSSHLSGSPLDSRSSHRNFAPSAYRIWYYCR